MKLGVLLAGPVNEKLVGTYGEYDRVFRDFLSPHDPSLEFPAWRVFDGELPAGPDEADAWIISGSRHGVYDGFDWIEPLKDFIRACRDAGAPMIGVCFGHQIMAEALGGRAEKSEKGWGLGPHDYDVGDMPGWTPPPPARLTIHALHQDQVTALPPDATRVASSPFCENAALIYGDPERPYGISIQPHPEFSDGWTRDLLDVRKDAFPPDLHAEALRRTGAPLSRDWAARWFLAYLKQVSA